MQTKTISHSPLDSFQVTLRHPQLHVMMAQAAFYSENYDKAKEVLHLYFQREPEKDQWYCNGKIINVR